MGSEPSSIVAGRSLRDEPATPPMLDEEPGAVVAPRLSGVWGRSPRMAAPLAQGFRAVTAGAAGAEAARPP